MLYGDGFGGAFGGPGPTEVCPRKGVYTLPVQQEDVTNFGTNANYCCMYNLTSCFLFFTGPLAISKLSLALEKR